jgi:hypothetical protein
MAEWIYRATATLAGLEETAELLDEGFLVRNPYDQSHRPIPNVFKVVAGDVLHVYHGSSGAYSFLGAFRLIDGAITDDTAPLVHEGSTTAIVRVTPGSALDRTLARAGYLADPFLKVRCGWAVEEVDRPSYPGVGSTLSRLGNSVE